MLRKTRDRKNILFGMSIHRDRREHKLWPITRKVYQKGIEAVSHGKGGNAQGAYASVVGSLIYAMECTRAYITHAISVF